METTILDKKEAQAVALIKAAAGNDTVEVCFSGGKDSSVILHLTKLAKISYRAIYKNTTLDPPGTIKFCKAQGVEIRQPKRTFFDIVKSKGLPNRYARFCCSELKEYKILDKAIMGVRRAESTKRAVLYDPNEYVVCREYDKSKTKHVNVILPILNWTDEDVENYIKTRKIKVHPLYYDEQGNFHVKRRLGCYACPLQSDRGLADLKRNPKFTAQLLKSLQIYFETHGHTKSVQRFKTIYGLLAFCLFFDNLKTFSLVDNGIFGPTDWKAVLERQLGYSL